MAHDVFISYASKDINTVKAIVNHLEGKKIRCWYADRDIPAGEDWASSIMEALNSAKLFVLVFTDFSNESKQVLREVNNAVNNGIPIIPFKLTKKDPTGGMMYYLSTVHWLDAMDADLEKSIEELGETASAILSGKAVSIKETAPTVAMPKKKKIIPIIAFAVGAVVAIALVILGINGKLSSKNEDMQLETGTTSTAESIEEEYTYDPFNLCDFIKRDDSVDGNGQLNISLIDAELEEEADSGKEVDNYISYGFKSIGDSGFPLAIDLWSVWMDVDKINQCVSYGGYVAGIPYEACTKMIDCFAKDVGVYGCYIESMETSDPIEELSIDQFKQLFADKSIDETLGYRIIDDQGDSILFKNEGEYYLTMVITFSNEE